MMYYNTDGPDFTFHGTVCTEESYRRLKNREMMLDTISNTLATKAEVLECIKDELTLDEKMGVFYGVKEYDTLLAERFHFATYDYMKDLDSYCEKFLLIGQIPFICLCYFEIWDIHEEDT